MASLCLTTTSLHRVHNNIINMKLNYSCRTQLSLSRQQGHSTDGSSSKHLDKEEMKKGERRDQEKRWNDMASLRKKIYMGAEKVRESMSPKRKGDWKDVMLMSFSFAVYVYISQKIVCAYCAWMAILNHT